MKQYILGALVVTALFFIMATIYDKSQNDVLNKQSLPKSEDSSLDDKIAEKKVPLIKTLFNVESIDSEITTIDDPELTLKAVTYKATISSKLNSSAIDNYEFRVFPPNKYFTYPPMLIEERADGTFLYEFMFYTNYYPPEFPEESLIKLQQDRSFQIAVYNKQQQYSSKTGFYAFSIYNGGNERIIIHKFSDGEEHIQFPKISISN
jgi:hypothetical protein